MPEVDDSEASPFATTLFTPSELSYPTRTLDHRSLFGTPKERFLKKQVLVMRQQLCDLTSEDRGFNELHD